MPPVSQQGSRAALVTWSVVTAILAVVAIIAAIYFYVDSHKNAVTIDEMRKRYVEAVTESDMTGPEANDLRQLRSDPESGFDSSDSLFRVLLGQRAQLARMIGGSAVNELAAANAARNALAEAATIAQEANVTIPTTDNLALALTTLSNALRTRLEEISGLVAQLADARKQIADQVKQFEAARGELNRSLEEVRAAQQQAIADVAAYTETKDEQVREIERARETERGAAQEREHRASVQLAERDRQITQLQRDLETVRAKFTDKRVNTQDPIVRAADGQVIRIPTRDVVYINLGANDSITPGLTFEVYDRIDGVPPVGSPDDDHNLPRGKASIEVVRVGTTTSEARVVRQSPGTQLTEGDLIVNLVYDRNVRYTFLVYGDFDVDRNGIATAQEAEVIKRLVTQWGGRLTEQVNVDTDFVILGAEPVIPIFTSEELRDPFNAKKLADAQIAYDAYQSVKQQAIDLHIPILNQNRFLYLIGYFEQARR